MLRWIYLLSLLFFANSLTSLFSPYIPCLPFRGPNILTLLAPLPTPDPPSYKSPSPTFTYSHSLPPSLFSVAFVFLAGFVDLELFLRDALDLLEDEASVIPYGSSTLEFTRNCPNWWLLVLFGCKSSL